MLFLSVFLSPVPTEAFEDDLERYLQKNLAQSKVLVEKIKTKLMQDATAISEVTQLRKTAEDIRVSDLLLEERFKLRTEKAKALGTKAVDRHKVMAEGYRAALTEYLSIIDGLPPDGSIPQSAIRNLQSLLEKILPKRNRPLIGSLPYKHLNYPSKEPNTSSAITPAYKGGNKTVNPDDSKSTPEAPISKEIAALAQSLNWQPVAIYEYVKNTVETEWYYGCMKGAEETLRQKSGNDCDQATLLAALLRASGFPTRYVRGTIEFFPDSERAKNLTGIDDPWKIAEFFQKAGIPYKPIIAGGKIANFQIEHIWVESQIPYANYRGAIIDEHGKTWLGLDTSIKVKDYVYNNPKDIFQEPGISSQLVGMRDEYLGAVQTQTPLEYLQSRINSELQTLSSQFTYSNFLSSRTLAEEHMKILPAGMQFTEIKITNEYTTIPDELKHKVRFIAKNSQNSELLNVELDTFKLSNQPVAITYEPETVEDQEIIDSYGGLDNTPAYLVRLRPVLKINNERIIVAQDGLPMGSEYALTIDLVSPQGTETITNSMITGNLTVIGITAGRAAQSSELSVQGEKDAERLLYESAQHYIDRWNKAEDELASLLHLSVARPLPTVVTLGGMIDVTYLLDMPHGFTWKGVYIDADHRSIETVTRTQSTDDRQKLFMQLASLQGSILENRIFEDDFKVESISTAKLMQLCTSNSVLCTQILTIDKTSVDAILPTLYFDDNIKVDILNAVNQNFSIRIPQSDITYHDWTGTGYIKENLDTGESGWMLSGMIAGGCPVDAQWLNQHYQEILSEPYTGPSNSDPLAVRFLVKVASTDKQPPAMVDGILPQYLAVFVSDSKGLPVSGAKVTFKTVAGEGKLRCLNSFELPTGTAANECTSMPTNKSGIAKVQLILGQKTGVNPIYQLLQSTDAKYTQLGLNLITASVQSNLGEITLAGPFEAYGKPDVRDRIEKVYGEGTTTVVNNPAGSLSVKVVDKYGNPISNVPVTFSAAPASSLEPAVTLPTVEQGFRNIEFYRSEECNSGNHIPYPLYGDCSKYYPEIGVSTEYFGAVVNAVLGNTVNTKYTVKASATGISSAEFTLKSTGYRATNDNYLPTGIYMGYLTIVNDKGEPVNAARAGEELKAPLLSEFYQYSDDYMTEGPTPCNINNQWTSCWKVKPTGTVTMKKVENGTVTFTPAQGGGVSVPINTNEAGLYGARYTTGVAPAVNKIIAEGRANIDVAVVYYYSSTKEYLAPSSWPTTTNITLNSGQSALFNSSTNAPIYLPTSDTKQTLEYIVYGVDVPLTIEPGLILVNDDGQTTTDMTFKYTILPPEYNAVIADVDVFTSDTNTDTWVGYLPGDKTQGQGSAGYVKGSRFDINTHYKAQVVLNRGTDAEVKGRTEIRNDNSGNDNIVCEQNEDCMDKVTIPFGKIELFTVPSTTQEAPVSVIGGATDGVTKLQLKLTVKYGFEELSDLNWNLMDPQLLSAATSTERGSILDDQGNNIDSWPVTFYSIDSSGVATTTYRVPQTFVRFGTSQETQDKDRPDRNVQIRLADSSNNAQGSSDLRLIRPPVLLVHGLWGSGDRNDKKEYTWKIFEPALNQKGLFEINNVDYHRTNASSIAVNAQRIERGLDDMLGLLYDKRFAATRVDIIAHSMGGLITRHYCMNGFSDCIERIHKFITIDTPHEGSELADILAVYRQNRNLIENQVNLTPPFTCYGAVDAFISGKYLFKKMKPHPIHLGAIDDLASGRWTEPPFNAVASGPWTSLPALSSDTSGLTAHTIAGVATGSGLDSDMEALWDKVLSHCGFTLERVFGISATTNDRIVTQDSQDGSLDFPASEVFTGVDHFSILRSVDVVDRMKDLLESCMPSADFEGGL